jgi:uracil DNA glycosylase superfamily
LCRLQKLIIGESPYPGNTYYEPLTLTLDELKRDFKNYLKVVSNSNNSIDELDESDKLVVAFVPKLKIKMDLHRLVSFRRVICMIYGPEKAQNYISELYKEIKGIKSRGDDKAADLEKISKRIAKELHDDGIVLLNVLKSAPDENNRKGISNDYMNAVFEYCKNHPGIKTLFLGKIAVDECNSTFLDNRDNIFKYYHPSGRVMNEEKWKGIDYENNPKLSTLEEIKKFMS